MIQDVFGEERWLPHWAASLAVFMAILYYLRQKDRNLPPGPKGLPFVGYWPFLKDDKLHLQLDELSQKYGDVCSFRVTGTLYVLLSSFKAIREAQVTKFECFTERCTNYNLLKHSYDKGVAFANYEEWKTLRRFFVQNLRNFGLNKFSDDMVRAIYDSLQDTVRQLKNKNGEPVDFLSIVSKGCIEAMKYLVFGGSHITEAETKEFLENYREIVESFTSKRCLATGFVAKYLIFPYAFDFKKFLATNEKVDLILEKIVTRHQETFDPNRPRNIIDEFYIHKKKLEEEGDPANKHFTDKALVRSLSIMAGDGAISVIYFVIWMLQELIKYPDEQERMFQEISETVGNDRQPTLEDKSRLPYTNAVINEIIRDSDFFPAFPSLQCTTETTIGGYRIPKGSVNLINLWSAHHDPRAYQEPNTFNPFRFVSKSDRTKNDLPCLFGIGKRSCFGEGFAMNQIFLNVATVVKNFKLTQPQENKIETAHLGEGAIYMACAHPRS